MNNNACQTRRVYYQYTTENQFMKNPIYQGKPEGYQCDLLDVKTTSNFPLSGNMAGKPSQSKPSQESSKMLWSHSRVHFVYMPDAKTCQIPTMTIHNQVGTSCDEHTNVSFILRLECQKRVASQPKPWLVHLQTNKFQGLFQEFSRTKISSQI